MSVWRLAGVLVLAAGLAGQTATAATVTWTFLATVQDGPLTGEVANGSFSYDDTGLGTGFAILTPAPADGGLTVSLTFDRQTFNETNDVDYPQFEGDFYPQVAIEDLVPLYLDFALLDGVNGVSFANPLVLGLTLGDFVEAPGPGYDFTTELLVETVPVPAALPLLATALALLGVGFGRRRRSAGL